MPTRSSARAALTILLAVATLAASCAGLAGARASLVFESTSQPHALAPAFTTRVFTARSLNSADIFLTDIDDLATPDAHAERMTGNILHVHMFLYPKAGRTPIDFTASNATITHVVLADGAYGVYSGGGFLLPARKPTKGSTFKGRIADATLKPTIATDAFADRLGWNELSGRISATRDDQRAGDIRAFLAALLANPDLASIDD